MSKLRRLVQQLSNTDRATHNNRCLAQCHYLFFKKYNGDSNSVTFYVVLVTCLNHVVIFRWRTLTFQKITRRQRPTTYTPFSLINGVCLSFSYRCNKSETFKKKNLFKTWMSLNDNGTARDPNKDNKSSLYVARKGIKPHAFTRHITGSKPNQGEFQAAHK